MKKYPYFDEAAVKNNIGFYKRIGKEGPIVSIDKFVEELMSYRNEKLKGLYKTLITLRDNKDLITEDSLMIVNKLIGDHKLMSKAIVIYDGSYLNNRIWCDITAGENEMVLELIPQFNLWKDKAYDKFEKLDSIQKINWLYNNFDYIFIHIDMMYSRHDIVRFINNRHYLHKTSHYDYYITPIINRDGSLIYI